MLQSPALRTTFSTIETTYEIALPINENAVERCDEYDEWSDEEEDFDGPLTNSDLVRCCQKCSRRGMNFTSGGMRWIENFKSFSPGKCIFRASRPLSLQKIYSGPNHGGAWLRPLSLPKMSGTYKNRYFYPLSSSVQLFFSVIVIILVYILATVVFFFYIVW